MSREELDKIDFAGFDWTLLSGYALHQRGSRDAIHRWLQRVDPIPRLVFDPSPEAGFLKSYHPPRGGGPVAKVKIQCLLVPS